MSQEIRCLVAVAAFALAAIATFPPHQDTGYRRVWEFAHSEWDDRPVDFQALALHAGAVVLAVAGVGLAHGVSPAGKNCRQKPGSC